MKRFFSYLLVFCSLSLGNGVMAEALFHICRCASTVSLEQGTSCCEQQSHCPMVGPVASSCCASSSVDDECQVVTTSSRCSQCLYVPIWLNSLDMEATSFTQKAEVEDSATPLPAVSAPEVHPSESQSFNPILIDFMSIQTDICLPTTRLRL